MPTRNVVLTDRHEQIIDSLVGSGRYQNASEVLRDGLRLVEEREQQREVKLDLLRDAARLGIADIENGNYRTFASRDALSDHLGSLTEQAVRQAAD
ncbi:type II toxin-antitoxin system ParD family antitoxin [Sphingomonas sp. RT2P30]|uniref:type II toxin-antitoxin system ParD family antitoxin n=1 Tax=Parasphingomonas halimpatiens TaxID=3096162 RepID=UPI002FCC46E6